MTGTQQLNPAEAYHEYYGPAIFTPLCEVLLDHVAPAAGDRVLDVACGTGIVTRAAAAVAGPTGHALGVDINPAMVEVARSLPVPDGANVEFRQGDALALDVPDASADLVLCQQGLQFFPDRAAGLAEMRRALGPGGRLGLAVWLSLEHQELYAALADAEAPHLEAAGMAASTKDRVAPFSLGDQDELRALLTGAGFGDLEVAVHTIEARFATPERFVERMELAYAAVIPAFMEDPGTFNAYVDAVARDTRDVVDRYRQGDAVVVPMPTHVVSAVAGP